MQTPDPAPVLRLLGGAVILSGDTPLGGPAAHRHRLALLALLATNGRPMSRDKLVALLWPERDTERARNLLKTAVHELRKLLGEGAIRSTGDQLSVDTSVLRCDVTDFEAAIAASDLTRAAALYAGPFLDGFFLKDSSEFEHWVDGQRARLASAQASVVRQLESQGGLVAAAPVTIGTSSVAHAPHQRVDTGPATVTAPAPRRRWPIGVAAVLALGVVAALVGSARDRDSGSADSVSLAGAAPATPVLLPDTVAGHALLFDGTAATASTAEGTLVTPQIDNVEYDMLVRYEGPTGRKYQMIFYNGHGAVSGWGLMVVGADDKQADGTVALLAGGITISATPFVLKRGVWQHLRAERRDGRVTVSLDDQTYVAGPFPVNPVAAKHKAIERTSVGGDGLFDNAAGQFRGAIDRLRIRDLASSFNIERWFFDEGTGSTTVGTRGTVIQVGKAAWTDGPPVLPRSVFWSRLQALCGHAFGGTVTEGSPADSAFRNASLVMHVRGCTPTEVRIAFHRGADRSRTSVITRTPTGFRLKHDHRHADGSEDAVTQYGGDTRDSGSFGRQEFHADAHTASLIPAARTNVWSIEIDPGRQFAYALRRVGTDRRFRVEFGLEKHVAIPPPPWGATP